MTIARQIRFWLIGAALLFAGLWVLRDMLLPFVAGIAIAYFVTPLVDLLQKPLRSRSLAILLVSATAVPPSARISCATRSAEALSA